MLQAANTAVSSYCMMLTDSPRALLLQGPNKLGALMLCDA